VKGGAGEMLTLYLACLLFGGILLAVSLFAGTDGDADLDLDGNADLDFGADADFDGDVGGDADLDGSMDGEGLVEAAKFFSFRNIVLFTAFFGLTGTVLTLLQTPDLIVFPIAAGMGGFAGALGHKAFTYLKATESTTTTNLQELVGYNARVLVGLTKSRPGKITINTRNQKLQVLAIIAEDAATEAFGPGDDVLIIRIHHGMAHVAEEAFIYS
jgi:hypothetical protein